MEGSSHEPVLSDVRSFRLGSRDPQERVFPGPSGTPTRTRRELTLASRPSLPGPEWAEAGTQLAASLEASFVTQRRGRMFTVLFQLFLLDPGLRKEGWGQRSQLL